MTPSPQPLKVVLAEDEPIIRRTIESALVRMGFEVRLAKDGMEGRELIDALMSDSPNLLITDCEMPGCSGEDLAEHARKRCQHLKVIFMSGTPQPDLLDSIAADANCRFLPKPFRSAGLIATLRELGVA
jgi:CheY-like chemotaxis protein